MMKQKDRQGIKKTGTKIMLLKENIRKTHSVSQQAPSIELLKG